MSNKIGMTIGVAVFAASAWLAMPAESGGREDLAYSPATSIVAGVTILGSSKMCAVITDVPNKGTGETFTSGSISKVGVDIGYTRWRRAYLGRGRSGL